MQMTFYVYGKRGNIAEEYKATAPIAELWASKPHLRSAIVAKLKKQSGLDNPLVFTEKQPNIAATVLAGVGEL